MGIMIRETQCINQHHNISLFDQVEKGIEPPSDLVSACNLLGEVKNFQDECVQVVAITIYLNI